jgi:plastocyanin
MPVLRQNLRSLATLAAAATLAVGIGCSSEEGGTDPVPDTTPASMTVVSGNTQTGQVGTALGSPLVVRVANAAGDALSGITVAWAVEAGGGSLGAATSTTNTQGQAQIAYTLGASAGTNTVRAMAQGTTISTTFSATATAPPADTVPATITVVSGNNQSATVGMALGQPLVAVVRNAGGQALTNVTVAWSVTSGTGALGSATSVTNGAGQASNSFTVAGSPGAATIEAAVQSNATINVSFTATATAIVNGAVNVNDNSFDPNAVTVSTGGQVTWSWAGSNSHNVTWVSGGFTNSTTKNAGTHDVTFASVGAFSYYCTIHGTPTTGMRGTVTVQ